MAIKSSDELKSFFKRLDKPTQQQFADLIDSMLNKNDAIAISNITGLQNLLNNKADNAIVDLLKPVIPAPGTDKVTIAAGRFIKDIVVIAPTTTAVSAGATPGGTELTEAVVCNENGTQLGICKYFKNQATVYFTGVLPDTQIIIF